MIKIKNFESKFSILAEAAVERFQQGGVVNGDYVKFVKGYQNTDFFKNLPSQTQDKINTFVDQDLHLRISAVKSSVYAQAPVDGGMNAADDFYVDVIQEYAPGLYKDPITVPITMVELVDTADALGRMTSPDSQNYDNKEIRDPKEVKASDSDRELPKEDTKLAGANKWDDKAPGAGNFKRVRESAKNDAKNIGALYEQMGPHSASKATIDTYVHTRHRFPDFLKQQLKDGKQDIAAIVDEYMNDNPELLDQHESRVAHMRKTLTEIGDSIRANL